MKTMTKKQKNRFYRIVVGLLLVIIMILVSTVIKNESYGQNILLGFDLVIYFVIGGDVLLRAVKNIRSGQVFDENFLMCIATIGAFALQEYHEALAVMFFYQIGEFFQSYAVDKSRKSISDLMNIRPDYANIEINGILESVDPDEVAVGDVIVVKPGEKIPLDGIIFSGDTMIDTSALTGESVPRRVGTGSEVFSGCVNQSNLIQIKVTKEFDESTVSKILEMVENASNKKAKTENFITRFAKYYTPIVVGLAVLLAILPPILFTQPFSLWIERALIFLVISCPCALVISVPLSFFGGIGGASRAGILIKGSNYMEVLSDVSTMVFDKTGTLTKGNFKVTQIDAKGLSKEELLEITAYAESYSDHPISKSIKEAYGRQIDQNRVIEASEIAGQGISVLFNGSRILAGNEKLMISNHISYLSNEEMGTAVYVARDGEYLGSIVISDELKEEAVETIKKLKTVGIKKTIMLTGDRKEVGEAVAKVLGLDEVYSELLPGDKLEKVEKLLENKGKNERIAYVGDGINDAPVLSRVDVGIAMGGMGSDAAIEAADIVLMNDDPSKISTAIRISKKTLGIARQNIIFALGIKIVVLILGALGYANMWGAVFADVGVAMIAILNAMRALSK